MKLLFLQKAIDLCETIEAGQTILESAPYIDPETDYIVSKVKEESWIEWNDCTINSQPDWWAHRPSSMPLTSLYLKSKKSRQVYFLST